MFWLALFLQFHFIMAHFLGSSSHSVLIWVFLDYQYFTVYPYCCCFLYTDLYYSSILIISVCMHYILMFLRCVWPTVHSLHHRPYIQSSTLIVYTHHIFCIYALYYICTIFWLASRNSTLILWLLLDFINQ